MNSNERTNQALRTMAGLQPPTEAAPVAAPPAPRMPTANAGNGANQVSPRRVDMGGWMRAAARGRARTEFITVGGESK